MARSHLQKSILEYVRANRRVSPRDLYDHMRGLGYGEVSVYQSVLRMVKANTLHRSEDGDISIYNARLAESSD